MGRFLKIIVFVLIIVLVLAYVFRNTIAKPIIEQEASKSYGAEVNIGAIDIDLFGSAVTLQNVQVTDRGDANRNMVQLDRVYANVILKSLLSQLIEVSDVQLDNTVMFGSRETAGVITKPLSTQAGNNFSLENFSLPDPETIIADNKARITKAYENVASTIDQSESKLKAKLAELPDEETIAVYKKRIKAIGGSGNLLSKLTSAGEIKQVINDISSDIDNIKAVRKDIENQRSDLEAQIKQVSNLPQQISEEALSDIGVDPEMLSSLGSSLFAGDFAAIMEQFLPAKEPTAAEPASAAPAYDIFIHKATINGQMLAATPELAITGQLDNLYWPLEKASGPATLSIRQLAESTAKVLIDASIDHRTQFNDLVNIDVSKLGLENLTISDSDDAVIEILKALAQAIGKISINGDQISGKFDTKITQAMIDTQLNGDSKNQALKILSDTLSTVKEFTLGVEISGTLSAPKFAMNADLDSVLQSAMQSVIGEQATAFQQQLTASLTDKYQGEISQLTGKLQFFDQLNTSLNDKQSLLESLKKF